jgi:hypothetical protein
MSDAAALTLTHEAFGRIWKALVSKRKARKLNVDRETAWAQLVSDGDAAPFLVMRAALGRAKAEKAARARKPSGDDAPAKSAKRVKKVSAKPIVPRARKRVAKKPAASRAAKRPRARTPRRGAAKK